MEIRYWNTEYGQPQIGAYGNPSADIGRVKNRTKCVYRVNTHENSILP